jgi:hypothetical protein
MNNYLLSSSAMLQCKKKLTKGGRAHNVPRDIGNGDGTMELAMAMALEMELCALFLETLDIKMLGPPKMQEGEEEEEEEEEGLQALEWGW